MIRSKLRLAILPPFFALSGCMAAGPAAETHPLVSLADYRMSHGRPPAAADPVLERAALEQARYMAAAGKMTHTTGPGRDFGTRIRANGVPGLAAENIAYNADSEGRALQLWANSPPHRRNMLEPRFRHYGVASAADAAGRRYWAMVLAE